MSERVTRWRRAGVTAGFTTAALGVTLTLPGMAVASASPTPTCWDGLTPVSLHLDFSQGHTDTDTSDYFAWTADDGWMATPADELDEITVTAEHTYDVLPGSGLPAVTVTSLSVVGSDSHTYAGDDSGAHNSLWAEVPAGVILVSADVTGCLGIQTVTTPSSSATSPSPSPSAPPTTSSAPAPAAIPAPATAGRKSVAPGGTQTITAGGFTPGERVHGVLHSTPIDLGYATADAQGVATFRVTVPAGLEVGTHSVVLTGLTSGHTASATFRVTTAPPTLAYTGADIAFPLSAGIGLLTVGAGLTWWSARRKATLRG